MDDRFYSTGTGNSWHGSIKAGHVTTHLHLVPRLRMSGAIPVLPLYALTAFAGIILSLFFFLLETKQGQLPTVFF